MSASAARRYGSITETATGRFWTRYTGPDGRRLTAGTYDTRREAEAALAGVLSDIHRGTYAAPERGAVPLDVYAPRWLERHAVAADLRARTVETYTHVLHRWILAPVPVAGGRRTIDLGAYELRHLTPTLVDEWYGAVRKAARAAVEARTARQTVAATPNAHARAWARQNGRAVKDTGRLPAGLLDDWRAAGCPPAAAVPVFVDPNAGRRSAGQAYALLRTLCTGAIRDRHIDANPCQTPGAVYYGTADVRPATPGDVERIADAMPARYAAAVVVAAWSALRAGELFALQRRHVEILDDGTVRLRVEQALEELEHQPVRIGDVKSRASRRVVYLPPRAARALVEHLERFTGADPRALVFGTADGRPLTRTRRSELFGRAKRAAGRPDLRWHDLRHTGATRAAEAGATLAELQRRMGHSTVRAALIYQHATDDGDRRLAERLAALEASDNVRHLAAVVGA
ncbi:site-specific integrase [Isoptericola sp. 4D.3]|uniref:Site-specific integrase n=1 Tax=Isoptericola peretonis TaxID=2918523 RepID=A0ABT0J0S1_9MICO|nr:site-specific integrase [Isoptericola sp. 4D.3]